MQTARGALGSAWGSRGYWCGCVYMCRNCARSGLGPEGGPLAMVPSLAASQIGAPGPAAFPPGPQCPCLYLGPTRHFLGGHREALQDSCVCGLVHGAGLPGVPEGLCLLSSPLSPSACLLPRSPLSSCGNRGGQTRPHTLPPLLITLQLVSHHHHLTERALTELPSSPHLDKDNGPFDRSAAFGKVVHS